MFENKFLSSMEEKLFPRLPAPWGKLNPRSTSPSAMVSGGRKVPTLYYAGVRAIQCYAYSKIGVPGYYIGQTASGFSVECPYFDLSQPNQGQDNKTCLVTYNSATGIANCSIVDASGNLLTYPRLGNEKKPASSYPVLFCMLPAIMAESAEFKAWIDDVAYWEEQNYRHSISLDVATENKMRFLCEYIHHSLSTGSTKNVPEPSGTISGISRIKYANHDLAGLRVFGTANYLAEHDDTEAQAQVKTAAEPEPNSKEKKLPIGANTIKLSFGQYKTGDESDLKTLDSYNSPEFSDIWDFKVSPSWNLTARLIRGVLTHSYKSANFAIFGEAGTGKTTFCKFLAVAMARNYRVISGNAGKAPDDLAEVCLPSDGRQTDISDEDFEGVSDAFEFGDKDSQKAALISLTQKVSAASGKFMYLPSEFALAYEHGDILEFQEANAMKPELLIALNRALEGGVLETMSGRKIYRHPNTVILFTFNDEYEGTKNFNQAVFDRLANKFNFGCPPDEQLVRAAWASSKLQESLLWKMVKVLNGLRKYAEQYMLGTVVGQRAFLAWANSTADLLNDPMEFTENDAAYQAALSTVIPSTSIKQEDKTKLLSILHTQFAPSGDE